MAPGYSFFEYINTFAATAELSRQLMCIVRCHWRVYLSFSTRNSAVHRHHSREPAGILAKLDPTGDGTQGKIGLAANMLKTDTVISFVTQFSYQIKSSYTASASGAFIVTTN